MKNSKKFCIAALSLLMLSSCGGKKDPSGGEISSEGSAVNSVSSSSGGKTEIKDAWWSTTGTLEKEEGQVVFEDVDISLTTVVNGEDLSAFNQLVAQFNAEYRGKINVSVTSVNQSTYESTVAQQIANNSNAPDLLMSHQKGHKSFVKNKLIQPFDEAMELSGIEISMNDYASGLAKYASLDYDGYTFGVPIDAQSEVVYYNKQMLEKYGGSLPTNHEELIELCEAVAQGENILPIAWCTSLDFFSLYVFPTAIVQNGGHFYDGTYRADWYSDETNRAAFKAGIQSIRDLTTHTPQLASYTLAESAALNNFLTNKALFFVGMPWNSNSIFEAYGAQNGGLSTAAVKADRIGGTSLANWFALDSGEDGNKIFGDSHFFAMSKTVRSINKKAAILEFMKWFTQNASVGTAWAEAGHISASTIIGNDDTYLNNDYVQNYITQFYPDINYFECPGNTPYYEDTFNSIISLFSSVRNSDNTANDDKIIKDAADSVNAIIDFLEM